MESKFHAFMFPWFAFGHMIPYLHLANKLAEKGHKFTLLVPKKAQNQLEHLNLFPENIFFRTITIPHVDGLSVGAETASDIPLSSGKFLSEAMDLTRDQVESAVVALKPDLIFFDFAYWVPEMARELGVKSVSYHIVSAAGIAMSFASIPPPSYPSLEVVLSGYDANSYSLFVSSFKRLFDRVTSGIINCDLISIRTCHEVEGRFCDFIEKHCQRKVFLTGPMFPISKPVEDQWSQWLNGFEPGSVVFFALGSQVVLEKEQFQELCLAMELISLPFLVVVKPPRDVSTIQEALPKGFEERVKGRGVVWSGWVNQPLILSHPSIGCFVNHCGSGSMWESLVSDCQIVFIPQLGDQILTTRFLTEELKVSVKVEREVETGWFSKESLRDAVMSVMDKDSELGKLVRRNHIELKNTLLSPGLFSDYVDKFLEALHNLVSNKHFE